VTDAVQILADLPSPTRGAFFLGFFPVRAYALCIILGIIAAAVIAETRLRRRGAPKYFTLDVVIWAVPFGIVGGRIYHVITTPEPYFGTGGKPLDAFAIWDGGLGIWGAIALGGVGAWIACRRAGVPLTFFADAVAPGLPVAQAIGRFGNWFNNELYGGPTSLPWGLRVYQYNLQTGVVDRDTAGRPIEVPGGPFQPTFLYEAIWNIGVAILVWQVDKRWKLGKGRAFALYVMAYTVGRFWVESLRIDDAHHFLGMRLNDWVAILVFLGALVYFLRVKGPQEHVTVDANGLMHLVTAEGEPIPWKGARPVTTEPTAVSGTDDDADDADDPPGASVGSGADDPARADTK
jgi:prolipoprotein diacylglyceryl transferase